MRTLLLTSAGMDVKDEILKLFDKPAHEVKLAHVMTAAKVESDTSYVDKDRREMRKIGFQVEDIDIEGKDETELRRRCNEKDAIYVQGGNTFYLLRAVRESGFDKVVKELIDQGVVYIGVSAGSYIACPTIKHALWKPPDRNIVGLNDLTGLNLVPFLIVAHYQPDLDEMLRQEISKSRYPVRILTDDQALLIKDGDVQLVGKGKEVRLD